jgi:hypothetical protein
MLKERKCRWWRSAFYVGWHLSYYEATLNPPNFDSLIILEVIFFVVARNIPLISATTFSTS